MAREEEYAGINVKHIVWIVIGIIAMIFIIANVFDSYYTVDAGHRGVLKTFGKVTEYSFDEGFHLKYPMVQQVAIVDVRTQKYEVDVSASSSNLQIVTTKIALNFHIEPNRAWKIYQEIGSDYEARVIAPTIQESVKSVTAKFTAEDLIGKRPEVAYQIQQLLIEKLNPRGLIVEQVSIVNFDFSPEFNTAIENKMVAEQLKLKADRDLERIVVEKAQTIAQAQGEAESIRIRADALKQNSQLIQMTMAEKWNGALPIVMMGSSGATPLFDMTSFLSQSYSKT